MSFPAARLLPRVPQSFQVREGAELRQGLSRLRGPEFLSEALFSTLDLVLQR